MHHKVLQKLNTSYDFDGKYSELQCSHMLKHNISTFFCNMPLKGTASCEHIKSTIRISDKSEILLISSFQSVGFRSLRFGRCNTLRNLLKVFRGEVSSIDDGTELRDKGRLAFANCVPVYSCKEWVRFDMSGALAADSLICRCHHPRIIRKTIGGPTCASNLLPPQKGGYHPGNKEFVSSALSSHTSRCCPRRRTVDIHISIRT